MGRVERARRAEVLGAAAVAAGAVAQVLVPAVGPPVAGPGAAEDVRRYDTVITPPGYAFAIWGPIFGLGLVDAAQRLLPGHRAAETNRVTAWPLAGAFALNAGWTLAVQRRRFGLTPLLLPPAAALAGTAFRRLQPLQPVGPQRVVPVDAGLLLGWTSLATTLNLAAAARRRGVPERAPALVGACLTGAAATATGVALAVRGSRRGGLPLAAATIWGLATTAADRRRPGVARLVTGTAALGIAAALVSRRPGHRSGPPEAGR